MKILFVPKKTVRIIKNHTPTISCPCDSNPWIVDLATTAALDIKSKFKVSLLILG